MRWLCVLLAISCGSRTRPAPAPPPAPAAITAAPVVVTTADAGVATPAPPPAEPPPSACELDETSFECRCEKGEPLGCVGLAESELRRGQNDIAIARVLPLCQQEVVEACFAAAKFLKQRKLASRHGQSSAELTARGMTILEARCTAGNSDGCLQLGRILLAGKVVPRDAKRGRDVVDQACTAKNIRACAFLGSMYVTGEGVKKDVARGTQLLDEACSGGGSNACAALANTIARKNKKRAQELYAKACAGDDGEGCAKSGNVTRACELEHAESCMAAGGTQNDPAKQRAAYQRACDAAIAAGCVALAPLVATGKGGPRDYGAGLELADAACKTKTPKACAVATELRARPPAVTCNTIAECDPLCEERIPAGCRALADASLAEGPTECERAEEGLEKACKLGDALSCVERGHIETSASTAEAWYERGCQAKHAGACALQARTSLNGRDRDRAKPLAALHKACKQRVASACMLYAESLPFSKLAESHRLWRTACDANEARACRLLGVSIRDEGDTRAPHDDSDGARAQTAGALITRACTLGDPVACAIQKGDASDLQLRCMIDFAWSP